MSVRIYIDDKDVTNATIAVEQYGLMNIKVPRSCLPFPDPLCFHRQSRSTSQRRSLLPQHELNCFVNSKDYDLMMCLMRWRGLEYCTLQERTLTPDLKLCSISAVNVLKLAGTRTNVQYVVSECVHVRFGFVFHVSVDDGDQGRRTWDVDCHLIAK